MSRRKLKKMWKKFKEGRGCGTWAFCIPHIQTGSDLQVFNVAVPGKSE